jgi:hypothetical protein
MRVTKGRAADDRSGQSRHVRHRDRRDRRDQRRLHDGRRTTAKPAPTYRRIFALVAGLAQPGESISNVHCASAIASADTGGAVAVSEPVRFEPDKEPVAEVEARPLARYIAVRARSPSMAWLTVNRSDGPRFSQPNPHTLAVTTLAFAVSRRMSSGPDRAI